MQTKWSILIVILALGLAILPFPISSVGEEGTGTLYVYIDPDRITLAPTDTEGRYVVVPGAEYNFKVSGITEYSIGATIAIWIYRTNTGTNIKIGDVAVTSSPFEAIFSWTIPDNWLDETVKLKYGTNIENNWVFSKKEIWVNARVGDGILYAYTDSAKTDEVALKVDNYLVWPMITYYFTIDGITEYEYMTIQVWARYQETNELLGSFTIGTKPSQIDFEWTIPDLPLNTEIKIKYGTDYEGPKEKWVYARRSTESAPRISFIIPEIPLGSVGAIFALFSGLGVLSLVKRKNVGR